MRHCLIIDDTKQDEEILAIESLGHNNSFPIKCHYFNPMHKDCLRRDEKSDGTFVDFIDEEKVYKQLNMLFGGQQFDLIATDYSFSKTDINGLELVNYLKGNKWKVKTPYVIYSSDSDEIKSKLQKEVSDLVGDKDKLNKYLQNYHEINPIRVFKRSKKHEDSHIGQIYEFIKTHKTSLNVKLKYKLLQHSGRIFKNIFPRFEGKPILYLSELVIKNTEESDDFENEFLDRCVDHFIDLKE